MTSKFLAAGIVVAVAVAAAAYVLTIHRTPPGEELASLATPPGVTLQPLGSGPQGYGQEALLHVLSHEAGVTLADAKGMTLYTFDGDTEAGKSACTAECAKAWPPLKASPDAAPFADWSLMARDDGSRQWAFRGKPLYTDVQDVDIGSVGGISPRPPAFDKEGFPIVKPKGKGAPPDWHAAVIYPVTGVMLPDEIAISEVADANGIVLVDVNGMTLYVFDGDPDHENPNCAAPPCPSSWTPVTAPQLSGPVGDLSVVARHDGIRQWAYRGKPLYRFKGDLVPSDAYGIGADPHYRPAQLVRYFMPPGVAMGQTLGRGTVLTTAEGITLYRRDGFAYQPSGGHAIRHGVPIRPAVGRDIGTQTCDADCLMQWRPLTATADAQPSGYWAPLTRGDGSKQWAYQGFALYTYAGDKKPGDMTGNDIYDHVLSDDPGKINEVGTPMAGSAMLYWIVATP